MSALAAEAIPVTPGDSALGGRSAWQRWDLRRIRQVGLGVLGLQLVFLLVWSQILADRFSLTFDFSNYHQAWWLIGHGDLNPFDTLFRFPFWEGHGEFLLWPLALLGAVWPHAVTQLWEQDLAAVGAEAIAFVWLCEIAGSVDATWRGLRVSSLLASTGLVLLVADPWMYWALSWDFHFEMIGLVFCVLIARQLHRDPHSWRLWLWAGLGIACGDVVTSYVCVIALAAAFAGRRGTRRAVILTILALTWAVLLAIGHADRASLLVASYGYLVVGAGQPIPSSLGLVQLAEGVITHPMNVARELWARRLDLYAAASTGGLVGALWPAIGPVVILVLVEGGLNGYLGLALPGFQNALLFVLLPVGAVAVISRLARGHLKLVPVLAGVLAVNALAWGAIWIPRTPTRWVRVSPAAASVLVSAQRMIPPSDEVIASQGILGRFSGRRWVFPVFGSGNIPVNTAPVWVVVAPAQGIETVSTKVGDALVAELEGPLHASLVIHGHGVWVFRWTPPVGTKHLVVPASVQTVPAWTVTGAAGLISANGPSANWRAVSDGRAGYVVAGDYWREMPGRYEATVVLSSTVPVKVEVWDATDSKLLARRSLPPTNGRRAVSTPVDLSRLASQHTYSGMGPFRILPQPPPPGNELEVRVWSPGGGTVSVSSVELANFTGS